MKTMNLQEQTVRELNQALHDQVAECTEREWTVLEPKGQHNIACGLDQNLSVDIMGHAGYFCAGMNKKAHVTIHGNAGQGVAENMMSGHHSRQRRCLCRRRCNSAWRAFGD